MANQMIALQARAPQSAGLGSAIQQNAQMINMLSQQKAAERQAAQAQQELAASQRKEARDVAAADIDLAGKQIDYHYKRATAVNTPQGYQAWLAGVAKDSPEFAEFFATNLPPEAFNRDDLIRMVGSVKDNFDATYAPAATENIIGERGEVGVLSRGGFGPPTIKVPRTLVPGQRKREVTVSEPTFVDGGVGGPVSADEAERFVQSFPKEAQAAIRQRINEGALGNIPMGSPVAAQGLVAGERGGVGGPYEVVDEGYVEAATPFRAKNPAMAPYPGSAQVPITRVREEAAAQRPAPTETYSTKRAEKQAQSDVEFLDAYESSKSDAQNILSVIDQMIGDLNVKDGKIIQGKRPPHPGFESVIGAGIPGLRFVPGTQSADFDAFMSQVEGGAFLKAYNALRGTGQITEKEGEKATTALSRMKRSQTEAGFVKAAREFEGVVRSAVQRADARAARLRGQTPTAKSGGGKRLKYNPATGELE